jgi:hypothetical protein
VYLVRWYFDEASQLAVDSFTWRGFKDFAAFGFTLEPCYTDPEVLLVVVVIVIVVGVCERGGLARLVSRAATREPRTQSFFQV